MCAIKRGDSWEILRIPKMLQEFDPSAEEDHVIECSNIYTTDTCWDDVAAAVTLCTLCFKLFYHCGISVIPKSIFNRQNDYL